MRAGSRDAQHRCLGRHVAGHSGQYGALRGCGLRAGPPAASTLADMAATVSRSTARTRVLRIARLGPCLTVATVAARAGCHPATAGRHLRAAPWTRPRAAHDPVCPPQQLTAMALNAARPAVASIAVRHPHCPPAALDRHADMMWGMWAHARVVAACLARPATLGRFFRHSCRTTRTAAASNPATPPVALARFAADRSATVRFGVLANPACPAQLIAQRPGCSPIVVDRLAVDEHPMVRAAVASNASAEKLTTLIDSGRHTRRRGPFQLACTGAASSPRQTRRERR